MAIARTKTTPKAKPVIEEVEVVEVEEIEEVKQINTVAKEKVSKKNEINNFPYKVKKELEAEKKVRIFVPNDELNPDVDVLQINISGYIYGIPRGEECEVPETIYQAWKESYEKTLRAERRLANEGKMTKPVANL